MVVFPLGPQEARLWHPGVPGVAALAAAFPLSAALAGLLARRAPRLPNSPRALAGLVFLTTLPCAFSHDYPSLVAARVLAGLFAGVAYVAIHRVLPASASPAVARLAPRIVSFGMPVCIAAATLADWRFAFAPILLGLLAVCVFSGGEETPASGSPALPPPPEPAPWSLVATLALAFVTAAYLAVLSGYLVFNAGHGEVHIPVVLSTAALLGLAAPPLVGRIRARTSPAVFYACSLGASVLALLALLRLQGPLPAPAAIAAIATFLVVNATRHLALAGLVSAQVPGPLVPAHQLHTQLAHHLGFGFGALGAGRLVSLTPHHGLVGMPALLGASLAATLIALLAGLAARRHAPPAQARAIPNPDERSSSRTRAPS